MAVAVAVAFALAVAVAVAVVLAGCGLSVQSPDLFLLTRTGQGERLMLLVNDSGTISCNGAKAKPLPDPMLLQARDIASKLDTDAKAGLRIARGPRSVFDYTIKLQEGTISFPDDAAARHSELAQVELFALQVAEGTCGLGR